MAEPKKEKPEPGYVYLPQIGRGFITSGHESPADHSAGKFYPMYDWQALVTDRNLGVFRRRYPNDDVYKSGYAKGQD